MKSENSIWGKGEHITFNLISSTKIKGNWLNLAAGDGRYMGELLRKVDKLTVSDSDENELKKLQSKLSLKQKNKVNVRIFDLTGKFPFNDKTFDGIFCTGTLHLFDKDTLKTVFSEMKRVLKDKSTIIIDFATDIKRYPSNKEDNSKYPSLYKTKEAKELLGRLLSGFSINIRESEYEDDLTNNPDYGFKAKGEFLLIKATKSKI